MNESDLDEEIARLQREAIARVLVDRAAEAFLDATADEGLPGILNAATSVIHGVQDREMSPAEVIDLLVMVGGVALGALRRIPLERREIYELVDWIPRSIETPVSVRRSVTCMDCGAILRDDGHCSNCGAAPPA